jgi:hypothetical protein
MFRMAAIFQIKAGIDRTVAADLLWTLTSLRL